MPAVSFQFRLSRYWEVTISRPISFECFRAKLYLEMDTKAVFNWVSAKALTSANHKSRIEHNEPIRSQSKYISIVPNSLIVWNVISLAPRSKMQLVLIVFLIGWESTATFLNQWDSELKQNQSRLELLLTALSAHITHRKRKVNGSLCFVLFQVIVV